MVEPYTKPLQVLLSSYRKIKIKSMTQYMKPQEWYNKVLSETNTELDAVNKRISYISLIRILLFAGLLTTVYFMWDKNTVTIVLSALCTVIPFLIMIKVHNSFFNRKRWLEVKADIIRKEIKGLENDYSDFDEGNEFINSEHLYSFDLDLFGKKSLFQAVNRTCTYIGKKTIACWLQNHLRSKAEIENRQKSIQDLSTRNNFRLNFAITGLMSNCESNDTEEIRKWIETEIKLSKSTFAKIMLWAVPSINSILLLTGLTGMISINWFGLSFSIFVIMSFGVIKKATILQDEYNKKLKTLSAYARLISLMQKENWKSDEIKKIINGLQINGHSPAEALRALTKELDRLDLRNNQLLYVVLEGSMFFQLRQMVRIEKWKDKYGEHLIEWIECVGKIDAMCSLATFSYNHPSYPFPEISSTPFCLEAMDMGHPLMMESQCIKNDAHIPSKPYFLIITGANMAGKSTYLRTIGINYLLACTGAPVCSKSMKIYPAQLITSLRTSDSLSENESYFFAELKRLKRIIDRLNKGEELLIILDEILKGTNSADKQKGSFSLIRQFMTLNANGIIATHDLLLGELIKYFPDEIRNYCFEADIKNNELSFSYKMREGIAQNMNACFLMKKMGIVIDD